MFSHSLDQVTSSVGLRMPIKYVMIRAGNDGVEVREFDDIFGAHPFKPRQRKSTKCH